MFLKMFEVFWHLLREKWAFRMDMHGLSDAARSCTLAPRTELHGRWPGLSCAFVESHVTSRVTELNSEVGQVDVEKLDYHHYLPIFFDGSKP